MFERILFKKSGLENSSPNVWNRSGSARQLSRLELMFSNLLCKFDAADRYRRCLESLESEHWPNPLFDSAMILLHKIVQVLAGSYSNTGAIISVYFSSVMARCDPA